MSKFLKIFLSIFLLFSTNSYSQSNAPYPNKAIRIIVPFAAGGAGDTAARVLSQKLSTILNQSVLIENRPGAGAQIGAQFVASSAPDGYTILAGSSAIVVNPALNATTATYHPEKDFTPIVIGATQPMVIVVNQALGIKNFNQLKEIAIKQKLSFAS